ncbi:MAG: methyltransferase domain-containing protein [Candidatus Eiseniibacteriota bacterium]
MPAGAAIDVLPSAAMDEIRTLDLGCGTRKIPGAFGVDRVDLPGVDLVHDLDTHPYPIADSTFDRIVMRHVAEHVDDVVALMAEIHRIGRPGATVVIHVPHYTSTSAYIDPTHRHYFSLLTFDFFCGETEHPYVLDSTFEMIERRVECWRLHDRLPWVPGHWLGLRWLAERHPVVYERFLAFLFPLKELTVRLRVVKPA